MAIYDNDRLVIKICKLFYEDNMSQKDISLVLGISKPQVCRMLNYAKKNHIVEFTINNPYAHEFDLEEKLDKYFTDNATIGVMSGRTIASISNFAHKLTREGLMFVPLVGNMGTKGHTWHANVIAENFARKTGGDYCLLNAPILFQNKETCNLMKKEPSISQILDRGRSCNIALIGIGEINTLSTSYLGGAFSINDVTSLTKHNACASVCTSYISKYGKIIDTDLNSRSIGISLNELANTTTIAVSIGNEKVEATKAALKSGYVDIFMTSLDIAEKLLEL